MNPSLLLPPSTDHGSLPNLKFSFSQGHNRIEDGGWAREVTRRELPAAESLAGVNMRLGPGVIRELHWHKESEWAYVTKGVARITTIDTEGRVFIDDVKAGGIWLFPPGIPHSIQGVDPDVGTEFILVFNDGDFSEYQTLLITEWFAHTPKDVLAKNFGVSEDVFKNIPKSEKYIFRQPLPADIETVRKQLPHNPVKSPYAFHSDEHEWTENPGGKSLIVDDRNFPVTTMASLLMDIEPGALRELHWHPDADEWLYVLEGHGRFTVFDATSTARTFDLSPGDVAFVPKVLGHYIEAIPEPLR